MSDIPRQADDRQSAEPEADRPRGAGAAAGAGPDAPAGTSPFDEPTAEIPTTAPPEQVASGAGAVGGAFAEPDAVTREMPRAHVVSREDDVAAGAAGEQPTQRIPSYEELSAPQREPVDIAAAMDRGLSDEQPTAKRGTLDVGLLVVRVVLGAILFAHGLQKLTGNWGGPDLDAYRDILASSGFDYAHALSIAGPVGEVIVGVLLVVGFVTPIAAAGAIAIMINAWCYMQAGTPGLQFFADQSGVTGSGVELETMLLAAAVGVVLTGPGLISLDVKRGWVRRPRFSAIGFLILGIAAGVVVWVVFNGTNPFG